MLNNRDLLMANMLNTIVPISRFNKGEANKIFDEVKKSGSKIVVKNNIPTCVLITPEKYEEMINAIEDYKLLLETEKRMKNINEEELISQSELMKDLDISEKDLENIEVDFE
ncbi:TPA: type II toxin-antitoxin system Phd/YefM family antitoxin [Clostridioides difficile]|uniref:Type II toxin-antitoxin system Phd/YefM family antitoxin n=1 Tax=Clostridioides difficile TaxID=1496 RepID=A0AAN5VKB3_CLODI|nr:type II toxin-antitoxin system Phd/YefM family antitoxin [Clostridioides difficile]EGT3640550.1 type II toxin-antitoxin system Phd/YefM family antitoxin [Clostridioides difficile]EGT4117156.1 type II toxin-antitoxin system Phd/YefM family antitoxin [Clostridioides difficile]EGT4176584.1 type II toxin-antitoxin system Phd/YefM family antitoxin [Clostridioides difficile]EGT4183811.1 type II toxin-antitoxin system Phd/YefM family antitoxin [Clostridioides difficile]EGT4199070.1 type II toxin-a